MKGIKSAKSGKKVTTVKGVIKSSASKLIRGK